MFSTLFVCSLIGKRNFRAIADFFEDNVQLPTQIVEYGSSTFVLPDSSYRARHIVNLRLDV